MKSFLMLGQSNMAGRGFLHEVSQICNEHIYMLKNGRWQMMSEPINSDRSVAGVSLASSFAQAYRLDHPNEDVGLIPCAEGGSSIDEWSIDKPLFKHAINEAKFALENSEIVGILWHQGKSDSYQDLYKTYYEKLKIIIDTLRKELQIEEVPILIGGLPDFLGKVSFGKYCTEFNEINEELLRFTKKEHNCYYVCAQGLQSNPDGIHIKAMSQRIFGVRYYEAFKMKHSIYSQLDNEQILLDSLYIEHTLVEKRQLLLSEFALGKMSADEFNDAFNKLT